MIDSKLPSPKFNFDDLTLTYIVYILFSIGFLSSGVFWPMSLASVIIIYQKKNDFDGTIYSSHFDWLLNTFWLALLLLTISIVLTFIYIGYIGILLTFSWVIYRLIRGMLCLRENKSPYIDV
ncbi:hypothetical protein BCUE_0874 [Candidatus Kinetoplastibacterium blastocrithidii TCC012E]|uniref:Transmembrane protein n=1 Tax=Candidatus Kinetoplastidibacterium blastocrithidiae TCC012E TaxID=1208922 RepID=M1LWV3_9PROT|nr:membrane protein [Candidatus Kinetoplastibacterium blastocrithidii]AFZ83883.1 membrane protein [Candidatus Kinetoplastibacterium blastocrithidii (ex Strigomonas culicis)]AGF50002.1 hypothetical protein BCUE_0874 [Candidatus Kinetoplastibacterium blastocrithidii TCC012E]